MLVIEVVPTVATTQKGSQPFSESSLDRGLSATGLHDESLDRLGSFPDPRLADA